MAHRIDPAAAVRLVEHLVRSGTISIATSGALAPEAAGRLGLARLANEVPWPAPTPDEGEVPTDD